MLQLDSVTGSMPDAPLTERVRHSTSGVPEVTVVPIGTPEVSAREPEDKGQDHGRQPDRSRVDLLGALHASSPTEGVAIWGLGLGRNLGPRGAELHRRSGAVSHEPDLMRSVVGLGAWRHGGRRRRSSRLPLRRDGGEGRWGRVGGLEDEPAEDRVANGCVRGNDRPWPVCGLDRSPPGWCSWDGDSRRSGLRLG